MHHSPFHSLSSLNAICKQRDSCIQLEVWRWGFSSWGCINSCGRVWLSCSSFLSLSLGGPLVSLTLVDLVVSCGGEKKIVYEKTRSNFIHNFLFTPTGNDQGCQHKGPLKERKDEHDSKTRPQEFMQPQDENPYLHTSDWIQLSHCLHIAFTLETE